MVASIKDSILRNGNSEVIDASLVDERLRDFNDLKQVNTQVTTLAQKLSHPVGAESLSHV